MKIIKFDQITEKYSSNIYYEVRQVISKNEYYIISSQENEYEQNYNQYDINDVINFVIENENDYKPAKLKIIKITEEELPDSIIDAKRYNI